MFESAVFTDVFFRALFLMSATFFGVVVRLLLTSKTPEEKRFAQAIDWFGPLLEFVRVGGQLPNVDNTDRLSSEELVELGVRVEGTEYLLFPLSLFCEKDLLEDLSRAKVLEDGTVFWVWKRGKEPVTGDLYVDAKALPALLRWRAQRGYYVTVRDRAARLYRLLLVEGQGVKRLRSSTDKKYVGIEADGEVFVEVPSQLASEEVLKGRMRLFLPDSSAPILVASPARVLRAVLLNAGLVEEEYAKWVMRLAEKDGDALWDTTSLASLLRNILREG